MSRARPEPVYAATVGLGRALLGALDLTVRAEGTHHVPASGPVVLAADHTSFPDFCWVGAALRGRRDRVRFLCRHDIWDTPGVAAAMRAMRHVPVDRTAPAAAYLRARRLVRDGEAVCLFPEAGISAAYVVRALMPGAAALARETGAPLVPVTVWGGQRLWPQKRHPDDPLPRPRPRRHLLVDVGFGEPLHLAPDADVVAATRDLGERLHAGREAVQRRAEHRPRPGDLAPWYPHHLGGGAVGRTASLALDGMPACAVAPVWGPGVAEPERAR